LWRFRCGITFLAVLVSRWYFWNRIHAGPVTTVVLTVSFRIRFFYIRYRYMCYSPCDFLYLVLYLIFYRYRVLSHVIIQYYQYCLNIRYQITLYAPAALAVFCFLMSIRFLMYHMFCNTGLVVYLYVLFKY
jgi:hypothetical protein